MKACFIIMGMMTIDDLAISIQTDLLTLRMTIEEGFLASKKEITDLREEMNAKFATHSELQSGLDRLRDEILEEIGKIKYAKEIDALRIRVKTIEQHIGINT